MIHHISLPAQNPRRVAQVLSEIWGGRALPSRESDSYIVFNNNEQGICIEVYPLSTTLIPGTDIQQVQRRSRIPSCPFSGCHAAISVPLSWQEIAAIAQREQWRTVCRRGTHCYEIIEFWLENHFLLELLTPEMVAQYNAFMRPQVLEEFFDLELRFNTDSQRFVYI